MRFFLLTAAVLLAGCAPVGPDFVRPEVPTNPAWLEAELDYYETDTAELAEWWKQLDDPVLNRLIEIALEQNNNLRIAGLRVIEAQASLNIARGNQYPQQQVVVGDATAVGASESNANTTAGDLSFTQFNLGASISWEIDFWGRFRRGVEAADASLLGTIADFDDARLLLIAAVADTYIVIRATEEQLRLARESVAIQQRSYDIVSLLYENGENSELDALQARTLLLSSQSTIPGLQTALQQARNALSVLLGIPPVDVQEGLVGEGVLPTLPDSVSVGIPANLLRQRPDVRSAELQAMAQNAVVGIANANLYPSFSLNGFLGLSAAGNTDTTRTGDSGLGELFRAESLTYSVGPAFVWPFLNYGRIRNDIRVQDARLQQALIAYRETVLQASREVEDALISLARSREQDLLLADTVEVAQRSADISMLRYSEGFADYQRVLNAQQSLFSSQQRYASNRGAVLSNFVALFRSLGGGWQVSEPRRYIDEATRQQMEERTNWDDLLEYPPPEEDESNE
jgi:NodT family efflux transporter outer membrane factor (OMF) lipoprotein